MHHSDVDDLATLLNRDLERFRAGPQSALSRDGVEVLGELLQPAECDRIVALCDAHMQDRSYHINEYAFLVNRAELPMG